MTTFDAPLSLRAHLLCALVRLFLRPTLARGSCAQQRARLETLARLMPARLPRGTRVETHPLGGVPTEWVQADGATRDGVILYLHGGAYTMGSPATHRSLTARLSAATGLKVAALDYRLAPEHPFPAAVDDGLTAYKALIASEIAARQIVIAGDSAGGGLALAVVLAAREQQIPLPAALLCFSPWADLSLSADSVKTCQRADPMLTAAMLASAAQAYLNGGDARHPLASPVFASLKGLPPLLIQVGGREVLRDDSRRLAEAVQRAGGHADLQEWPRLWHVFQTFAGPLPEADQALAEAARFVKSHLAPSQGLPPTA